MKRLFTLILIIFALLNFDALAQHQHRFGQGPHKRIEELRKLKLIEILQMDEQTTLKFFARQSKHQEQMRNLNTEGDKLLEQIEQKIKDNKSDLPSLIDAYLKNEQQMVTERSKFINSLTDLLTPEQLGKLLVFEQRFREEIRDIILRERRQKEK